ncbi:MAG: 6,7-dimethyl-8-ribityllumazine synthase [Firmicutes bacterium]|nr:6,7-dimethyl-8-ribityllumazine synthase [Bacillota bacterium]
MPSVYEGKLSAQGIRFAIVVSRFNNFITSRLVEGALDTLRRHDATDSDIAILWVPGSLELPLVAKKMASGGRFDAVVCLGAVIRGDTPHFEYVASEAAKGIAQVSLDTGVPTIFGVITADTLEQAIERAGTKAGNKGSDAALAAMEMVNLLRSLDR